MPLWPAIGGQAELADLPAGRQARRLKMKYFVYILQSLKDNNFYIGLTNDPERRIKQHNNGKVSSTKARRPFKILHEEQFDSRKEAREKEKFYKSGFGRELIKTTFINN